MSVQPDRCRGRPFLMALAELPDQASPAHRHAVEIKRWVRARFGELTSQLETTTTADAGALADQLCIVMDGVYLAERLIAEPSR